MLQPMRSQRVKHNLVTEQKQHKISHCVCVCVCVCVCMCVHPMLSEAAQGVGTDLLYESGDLGSKLQSRTNHLTPLASAYLPLP